MTTPLVRRTTCSPPLGNGVSLVTTRARTGAGGERSPSRVWRRRGVGGRAAD
ncbi:hypothetical protein ACFPM0_10005 [Pseudonocardia sulfidoxydans]|uniref:hypothetical protein n=1 Tax=Pseudonocardia sulfidoxydans TaxID=54011 RepID=UPI00360BB6BF